ncbi:MAG TPA: DUF6542 domain-containing protein [Frankiaceae bacterium]|nr:DUF6542 domain-containing protein [Frankiaceae bacterium]
MTMAHPTAMTPSRPSRPASGGLIGDSRGLTAAGAVAVALGFGALGAVIDVVTGSGLRTVFAVLFIAGCAIAAYKVHREDLLAAVVIPPLAYVALALAANLGSGSDAGGSFVKQQLLELAATLITKAPALLIATGLAATIALARRAAFRAED